MIVRINDFHPNYLKVEIETILYIRHKHYSKINLLKYDDVKFMKFIPYELYKKTINNKWVIVNLIDYIDPFTKRFLIGKILLDSLIRNPFLPPRDPNMKVVEIDKYIYGFLIAMVGFGIFALIFNIIIFFIF